MPELERVEAWRIVASPKAIDTARWTGVDVDVIRTAPDEALGIGATGVDTDDPDAILEAEAGFSVAILDPEDVATIRAHLDWDLDADGALAQGKIAGVPAKLVRGEPTVLVVQTAYADDLRSRLGW